MRPLIVANWKMHGLSTQLGAVEAIAATAATAALRGIDILVCPPDTLIERAAQTAARRIAIGGQDCRAEVSGSFTGDTSAEMLKDAGASAVIVGHSDRRQHYAETDSVVAAKASAAWRAGLIAIICVGETAQQRSDGSALKSVPPKSSEVFPQASPRRWIRSRTNHCGQSEVGACRARQRLRTCTRISGGA